MRVFTVRDERAGIIVVEGFPKPGSPSVGTSLVAQSATSPYDRPDLQIQSNNKLGPGSTASCVINGIIPAIPTPAFTDGDAAITNALKVFACRFATQVPSTACTRDPFGNPSIVNPLSTAQFCDAVDTLQRFPVGDTLLTVQLRDDPPPAGPGGASPNFGPTAQIIVRVLPSPTPGP